MLKLNIGSGQRRFGESWTNIDLVSRPPDQVPDVLADGAVLPFPTGSAEIVCLHHVLEHFGCGEGDGLIRECWRVLAPGGSLLVFVPDLWQLAQRWILGQINDYIYCVNLYGAYQGLESDRHRWGFRRQSLALTLAGDDCVRWAQIKPFDWRAISGMSAARDWWVLSLEAVK